MAELTRSSERNEIDDPAAPEAAQLLAELSPQSDLVWLVQRVSRTKLPWAVVAGSAIQEWETRDPAGWEKVSEWLAVQGITIVRI